ncbi:MAG: SpoIIE family protein phosphatase [Aristaeellaceae bacterium]
MEQSSVESIVRKKHHPQRWMPSTHRMSIRAWLTKAAAVAGKVLPTFLLAFADMLGIPSGLHAAYMGAMAAAGESLLWPACGCGLALLMRLVWGLAPRLDMLATVGIMLLSPAVIFGRSTLRLMGWTALSLLPGAVWRIAAGTAADGLTGVACMVIGALSAPVMLRALRVIGGEKPIAAMEERVAVGYLTGMLLCGGGRMLLFPVNVGTVGAAAVTLTMALFLGAGPGAMMGMLTGLALAMQGLPLGLSVAVSLGGFLAGMMQCLGRRWLTCVSFALGCGLPLLLMGASGGGCGMAVAGAAAAMALLPRDTLELLQKQCRRFTSAAASTGDGYAAEALARWEQTMAAMAAAVPAPEADTGEHTASWWKCRLCEGCPDDAGCTSMLSELARHQADLVWQARNQPDESWVMMLEHLRGLGCGRLYFLRERMDALRGEDAQHAKDTQRLTHERDMLITHLTAMAGAARRFAQLSAGEGWWEEVSARQLRRMLAETAYPASLTYARRVQGHAQVGYALDRAADMGEQAEELCRMTARTLDLPMEVIRTENSRVTLAEQPVWQVQEGTVSCGVDGRDVCGDTALCTPLSEGRYLAALSDGMGHGEQARQESRQTTELLQLCLEAGYTRQQTLTAVNGMMLLCGRGERFSTVDMVVCDLWTGQVSVDKLGAAASWLIRGREMTELTGDALPVGILEQVETDGQSLRLCEGDQLFLMTDGVEDAFASREQLRDALLRAADEPDAASAAGSLLRSAGAGTGVRDDRTATVLRFTRTAPVQIPCKSV